MEVTFPSVVDIYKYLISFCFFKEEVSLAKLFQNCIVNFTNTTSIQFYEQTTNVIESLKSNIYSLLNLDFEHTFRQQRKKQFSSHMSPI
jgi:hypothetical protein